MHLKCCFLFAKKTKSMGQKTLLPQKSKRGYKRLFFICFRHVSIQRIQASIIHIAPCSQEIIYNENPIFCVFLKMRNEAVWLPW